MTVLVLIGSRSDMQVAEKASEILKEFDIPFEIQVVSAHRTPEKLVSTVKGSDASVFIAIAGLSAALPGAVAANTTRPVIGVPVSGKVNLDSILAIVQMPKGVPVATVGLDRGDNAALLAAEILALNDEKIAAKLNEFRAKLAES
ncbi:MAG: 5-(carboxyamino)imidazole ribonucleotide mutase [Thermoplasmata archaeon]|nr:MAG: 5-(carboxyamino)imidazole ribonucleotide mutase [Thermoplasmata archaeon]